MSHPRDWMIAGPWWKWAHPGNPTDGRVSRPAIQKYDTPNLVNDFIQDPQRSLKFVDEDVVHVLKKAAKLPGSLPRRFSDYDYVKDSHATRKLFLKTHKRFYLLLCEIHCDEAGFPSASRADACEVGFVVRRRRVPVPAAGLAQAASILKGLTASRAKLEVIDGAVAKTDVAQAPGPALALATAKVSTLMSRRASVQAALAIEKERFREWVDRFGVAPQLEGWLKPKGGFDKVGSWGAVDETPDDLGDEAYFPMYPLIAPSNDPKHAGNFGTVYFGMIPTGSDDIEANGRARFDDQELYEARVFARRHTRPHLRGQPCKCPDKMFWSAPTEVYKLASHFDLEGTGHRPTTVQVPDMNVLAAQARPTPGLVLAKPPGTPMARGDATGAIAGHSVSTVLELCSFAFPVIMLVAMFLFELFLPVVMLLFGLFFLLKLKFCIPPEASIGAGITAEFQLDMTVSAEAAISATVDAALKAHYADDPNLVASLEADYSPILNGNVEFALKQAGDPATTPTVTANLEWETEVQHA